VFRLAVQVQPRASRSRIVGQHGDALKIQVQAAAVDGAANAALLELLAAAFAVPRRAVQLLHGHGGRRKLIGIDADEAYCRKRLVELLGRDYVDKAGDAD
jgi:uncharacterized protein (TIGR00251 family)